MEGISEVEVSLEANGITLSGEGYDLYKAIQQRVEDNGSYWYSIDGDKWGITIDFSEMED